MSGASGGRPWTFNEIANCFGVMVEDILLWCVLGGLPSYHDEWGHSIYLDCDVQALARRPHQSWDADEHSSLPLPWPSTGWVPASAGVGDPYAGVKGNLRLAELVGGPLDGHRVQVPRNAWDVAGWLELQWWFGPEDEGEAEALARYVTGRWRGGDGLMFDGYVRPSLDPAEIA